MKENTQLPLVAAYHNNAVDKEHELTAQAYRDLHVEDFFAYADHTASYIGKQYLYHLLRQDRQSEVWKQEALLDRMSRETGWRDKTGRILAQTGKSEAGYICQLFRENITLLPKKRMNLIRVCRFLPFTCLGLLLLTQAAAWLYLLTLTVLVNFVFHYQNKKYIYQYYHSVPQTGKMLEQAEQLCREEGLAAVSPGIAQTIEALKPLKHSIRFFRLGIRLDGDMALLAYCLTELFNIFFLTECYSIGRSLVRLHTDRKRLEEVFRFIGRVDVLRSVSLLRSELQMYCLPQRDNDRQVLKAEQVYHPLVERAVANDFCLAGQSALITGSNMSGKTCFIRTIGINLLSAKVLNTCFARSFSLNMDMRIMTSIQNSDDLLAGKSLFLQEVDCIGQILKKVRECPCLVLIDEPFGGTNSRERMAICASVLATLAESGSPVLVTTHDLELHRYLAGKYQPFYFCEQIRDNRLFFDYRLREGTATSQNAIELLQLYGYDREIVEKARELVGKVSV